MYDGENKNNWFNSKYNLEQTYFVEIFRRFKS